MNKDARSLRDTFGTSYQFALKLVRAHGIEKATAIIERMRVGFSPPGSPGSAEHVFDPVTTAEEIYFTIPPRTR